MKQMLEGWSRSERFFHLDRCLTCRREPRPSGSAGRLVDIGRDIAEKKAGASRSTAPSAPPFASSSQNALFSPRFLRWVASRGRCCPAR